MKGDPGEELRVEFEEWLQCWDATLLPSKRQGADGPYLSQYTELAWLAYKAGASRVSSAQRAALLALAEANALLR